MSFSEQLKFHRLKMSYTQQQIADLLKINSSTYCGYESEKSQPNIDKIRQIVNILNISSDILLETKFAEAASQDKDKELIAIFGEATQRERELIAIFRKLNEHGQNELLKFADYQFTQSKNTPPQ